MNIEILSDFRVELDLDDVFFANIARHVFEAVHYPFEAAEISLVITDDTDMHEINLSYRQIDRSTDVLSFPLNEGKDIQMTMLGDVVISLETAIRQADHAEIHIHREMAFLFIHGLLHLLGYDHEIGEIEEKEMFDLQELILRKVIELGICR